MFGLAMFRLRAGALGYPIRTPPYPARYGELLRLLEGGFPFVQIAGVLGYLQRVHGAGVLARAVLFAGPPAGADRLCAALTAGDDLGVVAWMTHTKTVRRADQRSRLARSSAAVEIGPSRVWKARFLVRAAPLRVSVVVVLAWLGCTGPGGSGAADLTATGEMEVEAGAQAHGGDHERRVVRAHRRAGRGTRCRGG